MYSPLNNLEQLYRRSEAALKQVSSTYTRPLLREIQWEDPLVILLGPRGVGKTTLLLQRLAELELPPQQALYVDMGDLYFQANRLLDFVEAFLENGGQYLFIDEVHRYGYDTWASELKQVYDLYRSRLKVVVTGSSVVRILNRQADLSRRALSYRLAGLSFREYLLLGHQINLPVVTLSDLLAHHREIAQESADLLPTPLPLLTEYWQRGYYPYFLNGLITYADRLTSSVQTVLEHDIPYATDGTSVNAGKLGRLLYAIASSVPFVPNISKLAERTGISRVTLLRYLSLLEDARIITSLRQEAKGTSALSKPDKIYLDNPNLLHALAPQQVTTGTLRETFFLSQLKQLTYAKGLVPPEIRLPKQGDFSFLTPERHVIFEVGGPKKGFAQIGQNDDHFVVADTTSTEHANKIPLWMFGLLY
ncbi:ATP-binding protein [Neolewinella antarctica]|uniref:AAA+ ATPase domain-containing protein n=1 Tax=Neolewinella antarctica TaxID=442734 RepID=A0ABX0XDL9_9BACT|nr:AAA family ATPase [Neolewinella antarctica]NJC27004.1 hypothetical protein [Neolewinella antarctica]